MPDKDKSLDPVIADIEKFMCEYDNNNQIPPMHLKKGRLYDSDNELLNILSSDNSVKTSTIKRSASIMPPKKRKVEIQQSVPELAAKKNKKDNKPIMKVRGRPRKKHQATIHEIKFSHCKNIPYERIRPKYVYHCRKLKRMSAVTVTIAKSSRDARTCSQVKIKEEIVDLTEKQESYLLYLKFAVVSEIKSFSVADVFQNLYSKKNAIESIHGCGVAVISQPVACYHLENTLIDLTDDNSKTKKVCSEKECAIHLVPHIHKYIIFVEANEKVLEVLTKVQDDLSMLCESAIKYPVPYLPLSWIECVSYDIYKILSEILVKNLNVERFLQTIVSKLEQNNYQTVINSTYVCNALITLLDKHRHKSDASFVDDLLSKLHEYLEKVIVKEEHDTSNYEIFTQEQLIQLRQQIDIYLDLSQRQIILMKIHHMQSSDNTVEFPDMGLQVKAEIISNFHDTFVEVD